jgi:sugar lactone lactonase YvrE
VDRQTDEVYVIYQNLIRIYNPSGMEIFRFGDDLDLGHIVDVAADSAGNIVLLSAKDSRSLVTRCNYRGMPLGPIEITNLPDGLVFDPNRMIYRNDLFYFVSQAAGTVVVTDAQGRFQRKIDLLPMLDADERQKAGAAVYGFTVDPEGNIFFSIPTLFKVYKLSPDGTLTSFGRPGSAAGRFGVIGGIAIDSRGNLLVADKLKCTVMAFDRDFRFLMEFGYRGLKPQNLVVPDDITIDSKDRAYVSQGRRRGVSVFALGR